MLKSTPGDTVQIISVKCMRKFDPDADTRREPAVSAALFPSFGYGFAEFSRDEQRVAAFPLLRCQIYDSAVSGCMFGKFRRQIPSKGLRKSQPPCVLRHFWIVSGSIFLSRIRTCVLIVYDATEYIQSN